MFRNLLATTAAATVLAFSVQAQDATQPAPAAPEAAPPAVIENELPPAEGADPAAPAAPQTAEDPAAAPAPDAAAPDAVADAPADAPADATVPAGAVPEGWTPVDLATVTPDMLIGVDVRTYEQDTIASVEDVLMSVEGKIDNVVARYGGFLGFGETQVLLAPEEVTVVKDAEGNVAVMTGLTAEELKALPEYTPPVENVPPADAG